VEWILKPIQAIGSKASTKRKMGIKKDSDIKESRDEP